MGVEVTKAIQAHDVIAMGKHYVVNDQEYERFRTSVEVDEDVLREIYLLPFEMLVKDAEIAAIMSAYNRVRGVYATENRYTADEHPARGVGLRGLRAVRLLVLPLVRPVAERGHGPRDARRQVAQRDQREGRAAGHQPRDPDGRPGAGAPLHADVPLRPVRAPVRPGRDRRRGPRRHLPEDRRAARRPAEERGRAAAAGRRDGRHGCSSSASPSTSTTPARAAAARPRSTRCTPSRRSRACRTCCAALGSDATVSKVTVADDLSNLDEAKAAVKEADTVILMAGLVATEGVDRPSADLFQRPEPHARRAARAQRPAPSSC